MTFGAPAPNRYSTILAQLSGMQPPSDSDRSRLVNAVFAPQPQRDLGAEGQRPVHRQRFDDARREPALIRPHRQHLRRSIGPIILELLGVEFVANSAKVQ